MLTTLLINNLFINISLLTQLFKQLFDLDQESPRNSKNMNLRR